MVPGTTGTGGTRLPASEWQLCQMQQVLRDYPGVFWDASGTVRGVEHHIPIPTPTPRQVVWVPFQPTPIAMKKALKKEVQSMLALGIIEESTSPWHSPPVLVPKPDGSLQFCIDFRHLS